MHGRFIFGSVTRIADFRNGNFGVEGLDRSHWATGDYVVGEIATSPGCLRAVESSNGRMVEVSDGDPVVGVLGERAATLEVVGDWRETGDDGVFDLMTAAGLFGTITSKSVFLPPLMTLTYRGHVVRHGRKVTMTEFVPTCENLNLQLPVVLLIGTSMSAGKTTAGKIIVRQLKRAGLTVIGAKLTGAARYRDVLSLGDAGADFIFDFVDAGLPSTVCAPDFFRQRLRQLLSRMAALQADVLVAEAGASPLEPYNGSVAVDELRERVRCTVLCASDPYAVLGVATAFACRPDLVAGGAANTSAAIALVHKLTGFKGLNLMDKSVLPALDTLLSECLGFEIPCTTIVRKS
ncbi:MAG: hypothetical protein ACU84J_03350 [Gammaproteobacteria bacterium]